MYRIKQSGTLDWEYHVFINNPAWHNDSIQVVERAEDEFGM